MTRWLDVLGPLRCAGCGVAGRALCDACDIALRPPPPAPVPGVERVIAPYPYEGAARNLVLGLKLRSQRGLAAPLAAAMARSVWRSGLAGDTLAWVPARPADVRRRGFDHARLLAEQLGRRLGLPALPLLGRVGDVPDQAGLSGEERRSNAQGAFSCAGCRGLIVLVDDLVTTGATGTACALALRRAGAQGVEMVVACRA